MAVLFTRSTLNKKTGPRTTVHMRGSENGADLMEHLKQQAFGKEYLRCLKRSVRKLKAMLVETLEAHCGSVLYTLQFLQPNCGLEDI